MNMHKDEQMAVNVMSYLDCVSNTLKELEIPNILKSYYLTKARITEVKENIHLPAKTIDSSIRCPRCCTPHVENNATYRIAPARKMNRFDRRLLKKQTGGEKLTTYQEKYLKHLQVGNAYIIKCGMCQKEIKKPMVKPERTQTPQNVLAPITPHSQKKKKKRTKDRFSGLNVGVLTPHITKKRKRSSFNAPTEIANTSIEIPQGCDNAMEMSGFISLTSGTPVVQKYNKNGTLSKDVPQNTMRQNKCNERSKNSDSPKQSAFKESMKKKLEQKQERKKVLALNVKKNNLNKSKLNKLKNMVNTSSSVKNTSSNLKKFLESML